MANQRKPHERDVLLSAVERKFVGYFGANGQIGTGIPVHERLSEPPAGTIYEQEYVLYQDIELEDGIVLQTQRLQSEEPLPKKFLRGRVVTDRKEVVALLLPSFLREMAEVVGLEIVGMIATAVAVKQSDGTEIGVLLGLDDVPPPAGVSDYAVGESPEEVAAADVRAYAEGCQDYLDPDGEDDELAQIRAAVKNGDVECVGPDEDPADADCFGDGGGHPTFPDRGDNGPRAA